MAQQTAQWWNGSSGRTGQLCSSQEFVPSEDDNIHFCLVSYVSSREKTTSGKIEKNKTNIKQAFNIRMRPCFIFINIQIKYTSNQINVKAIYYLFGVMTDKSHGLLLLLQCGKHFSTASDKIGGLPRSECVSEAIKCTNLFFSSHSAHFLSPRFALFVKQFALI